MFLLYVPLFLFSPQKFRRINNLGCPSCFNQCPRLVFPPVRFLFSVISWPNFDLSGGVRRTGDLAHPPPPLLHHELRCCVAASDPGGLIVLPVQSLCEHRRALTVSCVLHHYVRVVSILLGRTGGLPQHRAGFFAHATIVRLRSAHFSMCGN